MIEGIFFDLDGVLVDSERMHQRLFEEYLTEIHSPLPRERLYRLVGSHKSLDPWDAILEGVELGEEREEFILRLRADHRRRVEQVDFSAIFFPEVTRVIEDLRRLKIKMAVASSSEPAYIHKVLAAGGLSDCFDLIVSCDQMERSKPAPDIYEYCRAYFQLPKESCLVVEDSSFGIAAAKAAGLKVLARRDTFFGMDQRQADFYTEDLAVLLEILR